MPILQVPAACEAERRGVVIDTAFEPELPRLELPDRRRRRLREPRRDHLGLQEVRDLYGSARALHVVLAMLALAGSWLLIHTVFAFHYARGYYRPQAAGDERFRGLRFPGGAEPDHMDFLYYACVIGMTSQVADIAVTSRHMRRLALVHGVASFAFNLVILALGINLVAAAIQ